MNVRICAPLTNSKTSENQVLIYAILCFIVLPDTLRIDRGTETDVMSTIHCFLRQKHDDLDDVTETILYGPSTQNKIERWWRELHERMEKFFKQQLKELVEIGEYDSSDEIDRCDLTILPLICKICKTSSPHICCLG